MYRLDTGQARTDVWEQPNLDVSLLQHAVAQNTARQDAAKAEKTKEEQNRQDDIMKNVGAMGMVAIMPKDRDLIAGKLKS